MNNSFDIRGSLQKKIKTSKGHMIEITDISYDLRPDFHNIENNLIKLDRNKLSSNMLYESSFNRLFSQIKKSSNFKEINLGKAYISYLYYRDMIDSYDLMIDFFCRIDKTNQFFFFEAEINTREILLSETLYPRIYYISCFKFIDEYPNPSKLLVVANLALNSINIKSYSIVNILTAKHIYVKELNNPESFTITALIKDNKENQYTALIAYTIEEETHEVQIGFFEILENFVENNKEDNYTSRILDKSLNEESFKIKEYTEKEEKDLDLFVISGENSYEIFIPYIFLNSTQMKQVFNFLRTEKIIEEKKCGKGLENLLAGVSIKRISDVISLIADFFVISDENLNIIYQVYLEVRKSSDKNLLFSLKKVEKYYINEIHNKNKNFPTKLNVQNALLSLIKEKNEYTVLKDYKVLDIFKTHYIYNDNLVFPEHYSVSFSYESNENIMKKGIICYCLHDFDKSFIPISFYELDNNGKILVNLGNLFDENDIKKIINQSDMIVNMKIISDEIFNEDYSLIQIPTRLNYQINEIIKNYHDLVKSNIISSYKNISFVDEYVSLVTYSQLRTYDCDCHDLVSYIPLMLSERILVISELKLKINNLHSLIKEKCQLKSIKSFALKDLKQSEYPEYTFIFSLLCVHSVPYLSKRIEVLCVKKSDYKDNEMYFKEIFYVEFQTILNQTIYSFIYGINKRMETVLIKGIQVLQNNFALYKSN